MSDKVVWLFVLIALYWVFCIYWGVTSARMAASAKSFFLADRNLPAWVFVLAGTGVSFSGWVFLGHPALVVSEGFPFAQVALCAITIPLAGVFFLKRQWMLAKRYGYVTPAEMMGEYFGGELIRLLVLLIALVFAVPFIGMQLSAAGSLVAYLTDGLVDRTVTMWILTGVVFAYVCFGGMRAAAYAGALQGLLLAAGIVGVGVAAYWQLGGFESFNTLLSSIRQTPPGAGGPNSASPISPFEIPGVMQFTAGLGVEAPAGGAWTSTMILSYCLALMGLQLAPAFSMLTFSTRSPKGFAPQQTWAAAGFMGAILVLFTAVQGLGPRLLTGGGASAVVGSGADPVVTIIANLGHSAPWFMAILAVCALAAVQGITALYLSATSTMLVRDFYRRYLHPELDVKGQRLYARVAMGLLILASLLLASFAPAAQAELGSLALGFGLQLLPVLAALCWLPWITPPAAIAGLASGLVAVVFTDSFGLSLAAFSGIDLPWGRWPWTTHSAGWGLAANVAVSLLISLISQARGDRARRQTYHDFFTANAGLVERRHYLRPVAWAVALAWFFFAIGPGALFGNFAFGDPRGGVSAWSLGVPPIWVWQLVWWALGVLLVWFLSNRMGMSTSPAQPIELLPRSQRPPATLATGGQDVARRWFWIILAAGAFATLVNWVFG